MKKLIAILAAVVVIFVALILLYRWDSDTNHGFQFGYYADFNRVSNALASIPGITITQSWHNCDVTLEEFGFTATMASGKPFVLQLVSVTASVVCRRIRSFRLSRQRFRHRHRPDDDDHVA